MNKYFKFLIVVVGILLLSVILMPFLYWLLSPFFRFEKIFDRLIMVLAVLAAFIFVMRRSRMNVVMSRETWREYGFDFSVDWRRLFTVGAMTGVLMVLILSLLEVAVGPRYWRQPLMISDIIERFFKGILSGMTVGIVEEFFFRGFIFGYLRRKMRLIWAVALASVFYSLTHFLDNGQIFIPAYPTIKDAARLLFGYLEPVTRRPLVILPEFFGLFLFGVALSIAYIRTKSLFFSIGLHAGTIFLIKFQYSFIRPGSEFFDPWFGNKPFYDGPIEWIFLFLLGFAVWWLTNRPAKVD